MEGKKRNEKGTLIGAKKKKKWQKAKQKLEKKK